MSLQKLIQWSQSEFADLPWRKKRTLYRTLVSEIMLQQTTVSTVRNHYDRFLIRFPDINSLANASDEEMTIAWKGLGYYRRARNLKKIAETIASEHKGKFPIDADTLQTISGIGPYTANALLSIGMDKPALALDANLERVIARYIGIKLLKGPKLHQEIQKRFKDKKIFSDKKLSFRALNEALMDLGRTYCQARKASCSLCPLKKECHAFNHDKPLAYPVEKVIKAKTQEHELHLLRVYVFKKDSVLAYKKSEKEWLAGQYEVPTFVLETTDKSFKQYPHFKGKLTNKLKSYKTSITKYKITNSIIEMTETELKKVTNTKNLIWLNTSDENSNLSTATSKGLAKLST